MVEERNNVVVKCVNKYFPDSEEIKVCFVCKSGLRLNRKAYESQIEVVYDVVVIAL